MMQVVERLLREGTRRTESRLRRSNEMFDVLFKSWPRTRGVEVSLDAMADYSGVVVVIDKDGVAAVVGGTDPSIVEHLGTTGDWPDIIDAAARARRTAKATVILFGLGDPSGGIEATLLPSSDSSILALLRPLDFETSLRRSLIESRQRYKDLTELASDFIWETDRFGRFSFISPQLALGWPAHTLVGRPVVEFLADFAVGEDLPPVFRARERTSDEIALRRPDGVREWLSVSAVPLVDSAGEWCGARGFCRKVTEQRSRERAAARASVHTRLVTHLIRTLGETVDPEAALSAAAASIGLAVAASGVAILRLDAGGALERVAEWGEPSNRQGCDALAAFSPDGTIERDDDLGILLGRTVRAQGEANGAVILWRDRTLGAVAADERALLAAIADPLGGTIAKLDERARTLALSRTDPLTGELNRRGFFDEASRRHARLLRTPADATLVYIDLDNFKLVNDRHGHEAGDAALLSLCKILRTMSRSGDLLARLGGDEFVLWLGDVGTPTAVARAEEILAAARQLAALSGDPTRPLGLSLGLAIYDPSRPESPEELLARADAAMYRAKQRGKGRFTIADPATALVPTSALGAGRRFPTAADGRRADDGVGVRTP
jgi:diguanylate cyclase (GGDEF)-like protein/PAS domain S-box-containing protein